MWLNGIEQITFDSRLKRILLNPLNFLFQLQLISDSFKNCHFTKDCLDISKAICLPVFSFFKFSKTLHLYITRNENKIKYSCKIQALLYISEKRLTA